MVKKTEATIKNLHYDNPAHQGAVQFYARDDGTFNIEVNFSRRAGMETNRESLVAMRNAIDEILGESAPKQEPPFIDPRVDPPLLMELSDEAYDRFERNLEQFPMSTNLSLQRLLRRTPPWKK